MRAENRYMSFAEETVVTERKAKCGLKGIK
jgi:hypothetical protein